MSQSQRRAAGWSASRSHWEFGSWRSCWSEFSGVVRKRERSYGTLVYLISGLGTGDGISWSDAMRAAGSLFTSPGISIWLEVIVTLQLVRPSLPPFSPKLPMCDRDFGILPGFIARCQARFALIGPTGRAVLLKIKFTHLHKRSWPCVLRRRNASTPPTTHSPTTRSVFRRSHSAAQRVLSFSDGISLFFFPGGWSIHTAAVCQLS